MSLVTKKENITGLVLVTFFASALAIAVADDDKIAPVANNDGVELSSSDSSDDTSKTEEVGSNEDISEHAAADPLTVGEDNEVTSTETELSAEKDKADTSTAETPQTPPKPEISFASWKKQFRIYALENDISKKTLDETLPGLTVNERVIELISAQPEFTKSVWEYLDAAVSDKRVQRGRRLLALHNEKLKKIQQIYGVQPQYIVAIWGLESSYGVNFGSHEVVRSLASLAYGSARSAFFRDELIAALKIIQSGHFKSQDLVGSWAGAMGHTQFMPSTYLRYAVDFDGNERKDLWNSLNDVFASTANYLSEAGWVRDQSWGIEVKLPEKFDWKMAEPTTWLAVNEWAKLGFTRVDGRPLNSLDNKEARIFLPAGHKGPAFLTFKNFQVIKQYNNANSYALAVGYLGDRIRGGREIVAEWPRKDVPLSYTQKRDLQYLLTTLGYDTGGIDGKIGPNTRQALRNWQTDMGLPADGYVNEGILNLLR